ncbi:PAS domain-containing protein [Maribius pontilimi]|uniref:PAS domain-containing protein n=2 Tax=Palleronia pontilimi TaxID=1964209 RepID=A0A934MGC8_9RHOB|nr:PAS domain-containing protein [Palleronia pontilimi]
MPMFIADAHSDRHDRFTLRAINDAHTQASKMERAQVRDMEIFSLLPRADAEAINDNYARCLQRGRPMEYSEELTINGAITRWHTTLVPTRSETGRSRVVGNAVLVERQPARNGHRRVFEDINYFSVQSQFQLSRVSAYLDALEHRCAQDVSCTDLSILSALCRTVDRTLQDIRKLAEPRAVDTIDAKPTYLMDAQNLSSRPSADPVRRSLERLSSIMSQAH